MGTVRPAAVAWQGGGCPRDRLAALDAGARILRVEAGELSVLATPTGKKLYFDTPGLGWMCLALSNDQAAVLVQKLGQVFTGGNPLHPQ